MIAEQSSNIETKILSNDRFRAGKSGLMKSELEVKGFEKRASHDL